MLILTLCTDKPEAEIALLDDNRIVATDKWLAHRQLAETLHRHITDLLAAQGKTLTDITAIGVYEGPGSFTGLRIGLSVANALAYSYSLPMAGASGDDWQAVAVTAISAANTVKQVMPQYGSPVHITPPKK